VREISSLTAALAFALPIAARGAVALNQKKCADQFKTADLNNDGVIDRSEMGNAQTTIPQSLTNKSRISRKDYMSACGKLAAKR
jgi:hypothetical protein